MNTSRKDLLRVELHTHTHYSKDSLVKPDALVRYCQRHGIDRVAITDHNAIDGALEAKSMDPERVIVGEEIRTDSGREIIAYFVTEWVPPRLSIFETIDRLREQDAVISIPHPFDPQRSPQVHEDQLAALAPHVDAVEVFNARCLTPTPNERALAFAEAHGLLQMVGSDAHTLREIGAATLRMAEFDDAESFKAALATAEQNIRLSPAFFRLCSRYAVLRKKFKKKLK